MVCNELSFTNIFFLSFEELNCHWLEHFLGLLFSKVVQVILLVAFDFLYALLSLVDIHG